MSISPLSMMGTAFGTIAGRNKGMGGMVSGIDTQEIIKGLTSATRARIAREEQNKQLAQWRQNAYRDVVSAINEFQNKYLRVGASNLRQSSTFATISAASASSSIRVSATPSSTLEDITIDRILSVATAHSVKSKEGLQKNLTGTAVIDADFMNDTTFTGRTFSITVDGRTHNLKLDRLDGYDSDAMFDTTAPEYDKNKHLYYTYDPVTKDVTAKDLTSLAPKEKFELVLQSIIDDAVGTRVALDGDGKPIADPSNPSVYLRESIVSVSLAEEGGKSFIELENKNDIISIAAGSTLFGFTAGHTNRIGVNTQIKEIEGLRAQLHGGAYAFTVNGVAFSFSENDSLQTVMNEVNTSDANVRMSYSANTGEFTITSKTTGFADNIVMRDNTGNLLNTLFGAQGASSLTSSPLLLNTPIAADKIPDFKKMIEDARAEDSVTALISRLRSFALEMTVDGETKTIGINMTPTLEAFIRGTANTPAAAADELVKSINTSLAEAFGRENEDVTDSVGKVRFAADTVGDALSLRFQDGMQVSMGNTGASAAALGMLGYEVVADGTRRDFTNHVTYQNQPRVTAENPHGVSVDTLSADEKIALSLTINNTERTIEYELTVGDKASLTAINANGSLTDEQKARQSAQVITSRLNSVISDMFGSDAAGVVFYVENSGDDIGKVTLFANGNDVSMRVADPVPDRKDALELLGFADGVNNKAIIDTNNDVVLGDLGLTGTGTITINGKGFDISETTTMSKLLEEINAVPGVEAYFVDGNLVINGGEDLTVGQSGVNFLQNFFGFSESIDEFKPMPENYEGRNIRGRDAEIIVNGRNMSQGSNSFTINGTNIEVFEASNDPIRITMSNNPDVLIDKLKEWVADYNALLATLNNLVNEKPQADYFPLSAEQRSELSMAEIERWENEAMKGLLYQDPVLRSIISDMRSLITSPKGYTGLTLHQIGISTASFLSTSVNSGDYVVGDFGALAGRLEITPQGEDRLRQMILNNPDAVRNAFTHLEGIGNRLDSIVERAVSTTTDPKRRGSLIVAISGNPALPGREIDKGGLENAIRRYDESIAVLRTRLQAEYDRHWKQFTAMEMAINRLGIQSGWLADFQIQ